MHIDERLFRTSSYSGNGANCVDVALHAGGVAVRDTKNDGGGPVLHFGHSEWAVFLDEVINDRPSANGAATVTADRRVVSYRERPVITCWSVRAVAGGGVLRFTEGEWAAFRAGARDGEFGRPAALAPAMA